MKLKSLIIALFIFATLILISTETLADDNLNLAKKLDLDYFSTSKIQINYKSSKSEIDYLEANISFYPKETDFMKITSEEILPKAINTDPIVISLKNPKEGEHIIQTKYVLTSEYADKKITQKVKYPLENIDEEAKKYLSFTQTIDNDDDIRNLASELAQGEDDEYVIASKLAIWIKENINYSLDSSTEKASLPASWVLDNRRGVCDELTSLYISMLRNLGIPARFVSGIAYTDSDLFQTHWGLHGWAEVYFPKYGWVSFDPTYGQNGFVDATHIKLSDSADAKNNEVVYNWKAYNVDVDPDGTSYDINVIKNYGEIDYKISTASEFAKPEVGDYSYNLLITRVKNEDNFYRTLNLYLSETEGTTSDKNQQIIILGPNETKYVFWYLKIGTLQPRYVYTFPSTIYLDNGQNESIKFSAKNNAAIYKKSDFDSIIARLTTTSNQLSGNITGNCKAKNKNIYIGENVTFECTIKNTGNMILQNLKMCESKTCFTKTLLLNENYQFNMTFNEKEAKIYTKNIIVSNSDLNKNFPIEYEVKNYPSISITNITYPTEIKYDEEYAVVIEYQLNNNPKNPSLNIDFDLAKSQMNIKTSDEFQKLTISSNSHTFSKENQPITITFNFRDENDKEYKTTKTINIKISNYNFWTKFQIWFNKLFN